MNILSTTIGFAGFHSPLPHPLFPIEIFSNLRHNLLFESG